MDSQGGLLADASALANQVSTKPSFFEGISSKINIFKNKINKKQLFISIGVTIGVVALVLYIVYRKNKKANQSLKCIVKHTNQKLNEPLKYKVNNDDEPELYSEDIQQIEKKIKNKYKQKPEPVVEPEPEEIANLTLTKEEIDELEDELNEDNE